MHLLFKVFIFIFCALFRLAFVNKDQMNMKTKMFDWACELNICRVDGKMNHFLVEDQHFKLNNWILYNDI